VDPYRLRGLEVYSTVLWHCKREVELAQLAQNASSLDRHSPYAWCTMGNCFSLQKVGGW
jgi:anaphase-promoting complex subunit 3